MNIYQTALDVQDACNLSGVVHSFSQVITEVWKEAREKGQGTAYVNSHPVVLLFIDKLASLSGYNSDDSMAKAYGSVYDQAQA